MRIFVLPKENFPTAGGGGLQLKRSDQYFTQSLVTNFLLFIISVLCLVVLAKHK